MKLSEFRGEQALEVLANLIDPAVEILGDKEIADAYQDRTAGKTRGQAQLKAVSLALKKHKPAVIEILAALECEDPNEYIKKVNIVTLPKKLLEVLNDRDLKDLFMSQGQTEGGNSSGSASESTKGQKQQEHS